MNFMPRTKPEFLRYWPQDPLKTAIEHKIVHTKKRKNLRTARLGVVVGEPCCAALTL